MTPWGAAAGSADGFGVDADDLAKLADDHELSGLVDEVDAGDPTDLASGLQDRNSQNGNPSKINPGKVACFSSPNPDRQLPSFPQQSTTTSPPKHHVQPPVFAKTPSKNRVPPSPKNCCKRSHPQARFWTLGDDYDANHSILIPEIEDLGAAQPAQVLRLRRTAKEVPKPHR